MDTPSQQIDWHYETLPKETKKALDFFSGQKWLKKSKWYLAGGTALALQAGHRKSFDLDFFSEDKTFDSKEFLKNFIGNSEWKTEVEEAGTIYGEVRKAKVSFIAYPFFAPMQNYILYGNIRVLHKIDIAVMKITAISQRGRKRDFYDLYWCAKNLEPLEEILKRLKIQYPSIAHDYHHIAKALVYFADAEIDPDPEIYFDASWTDVKKFFSTEVPAILEKLIR
ncbi:MAG: nucleotidyl transferase AbiEii/AbiGii toxin family protein [Candidatus Taylorbacteria bacterium]|nr:nucleotidyl transferase AbiEii/AbiGii toxin family protein [Candidatus Taylorbacteria bacterium]